MSALRMAKALGILCPLLAFTILLSACSLAPRYERPEQDLPSQWQNVQLDTPPLNTDWWNRFHDPVLSALVEEALRNNQDLAESLANIDSAAAQTDIASAALFPFIGAGGSGMSESASERAPNVRPFEETGMIRSPTIYQGALQASWELDLWGKLRNQRTMLSDVLMSTVIGHEALRLAVAGNTANTYFTLLALDMQLKTAKRTLKTREDAFAIYSSRYQQGDITELDWQRAKAEVETARAQVHASALAVDKAEAALAVLLGYSPREIMERQVPRGKAGIDMLPVAPVLPAGLPSELLERRPDIRAAEFMVMANNANIGVARAQFFPSISLTSMIGTLSAAFGHLFTPPAGIWNYGITGSVPVLDFGHNWYKVKDAEARKKASVAVYRKTVQKAFEDVRTAFTAQRETDAVVKSMQLQVKSLQRSSEIARLQYDNGYTDYLTVLDAERHLFQAELQLAIALRDRLQSAVGMCMALGGGWQDSGERPSFPVVKVEALKGEI